MHRLFPRYQGPSLLEQLCSVPNLTAAWQRVRRNIQVARRGQSAGSDAVTLRDFEANWTQQMSTLAEELRSGQYRPLPPRSMRIPKAQGGERVIAILAIRDRVAQRAMLQVLEPVFDPLLLDCAFGCRRLVGVPDALTRVVHYAEQGRVWVVDADIATYFDTIDHHLLLGMLRQRLDDVRILHLIAQWLAVGTLTQETDAADQEHPSTLLQRSTQALRRLVSLPEPVLLEPPASWAADDSYLAARWEAGAPPMLDQWGHASLDHPGGMFDQRLWTVISLTQPAIEGAKYLWPHLKRLGRQRLALAGAAMTGALAAGELMARIRTIRSRGTLQGGALSPLLANIYLHPFDLALTSQGMRVVRFMDDFVIMCTHPADAERALMMARQQLAVLRLHLNEEKTRIVNYAEGLDFLGQTLLPRPRGSRLGEGLRSFADAEQMLRSIGRRLRRTQSPQGDTL